MTIHPSHQREVQRAGWFLGLLAFCVWLVWWLPWPDGFKGLANYLPLHMALETLAIVVGALVFAVGWNTPRHASSRNALLLACAFLGVAILDFSHTLSYEGMPDFVTAGSANKAIHFWLVARALAALALLAVALLPWGTPGTQRQAYLTLGAVVGLLLASHLLVLAFPAQLPLTYEPGQGLTPLKRNLEYGLIAVYLLAAGLFWMHLRRPRVFSTSNLFMAALIMAMAEFLFTLYADVTDAYNLLGHIYKVIAYLFLYRALFVATVQQPYERLRASQSQLQATLDALPDLLFEMNEAGRYLEVHASRGHSPLAAPDQLVGRTLDEVMPPSAAQTCREALREAKASGRSHGQQIRLDLPEGPHWFELSVALKPTASDEEARFLVISHDITARKQSEAATARLQYLSYYDPLTDLPNRALLEERFQYALGIARRHEEPLTLVWLDLDNFKDINDTIGHAAGDLLLREVAHRLRRVVRDEDTLSRQSGDDFVLLLHGADQHGGIRVVAALQRALAEPMLLAGQELVLTASMGLALYPGDGDTLDNLLRAAEAAMYHAKDQGRNGYSFFAPGLQARSARIMALGHALKLALGRGELRLVYQPQVSLADGRLVGAEALLRWQHPQWGAIPPGEFVPIAESGGLIVQIGDWVINTALAQIKAWQRCGLPAVKVAVNLSAVQFAQPDLAVRVARMAQDLGTAPSLLEMELTEAVAMKDPEVAKRTMDQLVQQGFSLSIDDFGTVYSSLSYLKRFAVYKLKIDQSFVRDLDQDADDQAIVKAIIQMAHSLGLVTLAEGVETEAQGAFLRAQGCDEAQGYYFGRPLEVDDFVAFLRSRERAP